METIQIHGARMHNLRNIDLEIPKQKLVVITGISGSGKSSLAFDILFEEGKNQYLRSIGILSGMDQEYRFDSIEGIGPAVAVRQNTVRQSNPRSTVGTKTRILNQLACLYASDGKMAEYCGKAFAIGDFLYTTAEGMCIHCQGKGAFFDVDQKELVSGQTTTLLEVYENLKITAGFLRLLKKKFGEYFHTPYWQIPEEIREEIVYGTFENGKQSYCLERVLRNAYEKGEDVEKVYAKKVCPDCHGERVSEEASEVLLFGKRIGQLGKMTLSELSAFLETVPAEEISQFGRNVIKDMKHTLQQLIDFGLGHLALYREMSSLSGGELERIFLHLHLESKVDSLIYIFDEPMAGLHPSEKERMMEAIWRLKEYGNTVIVVEHDRKMIQHAEHVIEIGPKAGKEGGTVVFQGTYNEYLKADTLLSGYLSGKNAMPVRNRKTVFDPDDCIVLSHATVHYLKNLTVQFPLHAMVGIAGVSGSGKSSLIEDTLLKRLASAKKYGFAEGMEGVQRIRGFAKISQEPIGRSASSTPASYIGIWDKIRELFARQPEARNRNMTAGYFSFHSKGACQACSGSGYERIFLTSDFSVDKICPVCGGKRYQNESLQIRYHGKTIADILEMSIHSALSFFEGQENIVKPLSVLEQMGMGYLTLGQPTSSLSGGEAQRVKLAKELGKQRGSNLLYVFDEPTAGLSMYDSALLIAQLDQLVEKGNSVIVIEHNEEVLRNCDFLIELGPGGGDRGGEIIAQGTPEELINNKASRTGRFLTCS